MSHWPAALGALLSAALTAGVSQAALPLPQVAVIIEQPHHSVLRSLRAEFGAYGFTLSIVRPPSMRPSAEQLQAVAQRESAVAAIWLTPAIGGLDVWILDRVTSKTVLRAVSFTASQQEAWTDVAAMRIVELLRASLLELELPQADGKPRPPPPAQVIALVESGERHAGAHFDATAAPALVWAPGGIGAASGIDVAIRGLLGRRLALGASFFVSLMQPRVTASEGSAAIDLLVARLSLFVLPAYSGARWQPHAAGGVGLVRLSMKGTANAPYVGLSDSATGLAVHAGGGVLLRISRRLGVVGCAVAGYALPQLGVRFARRDVASWGQPFLTVALGAQASFD